MIEKINFLFFKNFETQLHEDIPLNIHRVEAKKNQ